LRDELAGVDADVGVEEVLQLWVTVAGACRSGKTRLSPALASAFMSRITPSP
jgi:hypothetical protein